MKTKTVNQEIIFKATPHDVYEILMDSKKHSKFTDSKAKISREVNGKFTAYDGYIEGKNIELIQDNKIVQKWRGSDWPEGHYSKTTFLLKKIPEGTKLIFTQKDVPTEQYESINQGWEDHYWKPMKAILEK